MHPCPRIVSPSKLDAVREILDIEIAARHIQNSWSFDWAIRNCLVDLGWQLRFYREQGLGTVAWRERISPACVYPEHVFNIQSADGSQREHMADLSASSATRHCLFSLSSLLCWNQTRLWAIDTRDALMAVLARALDEQVDIEYDIGGATRAIPKTAIATIDSIERTVHLAREKLGLEATPSESTEALSSYSLFAERSAVDCMARAADAFRGEIENRVSRCMQQSISQNQPFAEVQVLSGAESNEMAARAGLLMSARENALLLTRLNNLLELN